tara:strand:+ start:342 stop:1181 length:840 start_codon:yes stop_codon:yes gene_type:complete
MEIGLSDNNLTKIEKDEIEKILKRQNKELTSDLDQMWYLMDLVWDDYKCDNKNLEWDKIEEFYFHPVWILNGLFIEQHNLSMGHRNAISDWIVEKSLKNIVDYGGGFGTLGRLIAEKDEHFDVQIYEPHPSKFGLKRASEFDNISIINKLNSKYDCLVSTDVLEHVPDPLKDFTIMINSVKVGGYLVIANCFLPVIKCHLPQTFHLRYTFNQFAKILGLEIIGNLEGSHAIIFKKVSRREADVSKIRFYEKLSKVLFSIVYPIESMLKGIKKLIIRVKF